uniref:AIPP2-like SPOC-like domain-containing protein n=1 Tax=Arundo donax TaxID=35708 RepID=A0A0A8ZAE0_ARUDO
MKIKPGKDNRTVAGAHQNKYLAAASLRKKDKPETRGDSNGNVLDGLTTESEKREVRFQLDYKASYELQQRSMAAKVQQPSILQNDASDEAMSDSSNVGVLLKENNCLPYVHSENDNLKENQSEPSELLDRAYSSPSLEISSKENFVLEASATEVEILDAVQKLGKDNPKKRRRLILLHDDDDDQDEEEKSEDVQQENVNPRPLKSDGPMMKHRIDTEYYVEEAVHAGDLNDQNLMNGRPMKRWGRYVTEIEDEEDIVGAADAECALHDATNCSLDDGAKLASQTISYSESADQQYYIYSQPLGEPVWSGVFKIDSEVFVKFDAHLSNKACQRVCELSRSLQPVVEVMKLPRLQAWPKRWASSGPTDDSIGLFFFPHVSRQNEVSNRVVDKIIKSDGALKVTVGIAELLIFPSVLLPEQYHFFQGKHYLWGAFKRRGGVQAEEQDGSAHAPEEGELHEQDILGQQDVLYESSNQETSVIKHAENQLLVERGPEVQKEAFKVATREDIASPGSGWSSAKTNSPKSRSNSSVQPRTDLKLHVPGEVDQQEDFTSSLGWNASSITNHLSDSGPAAVTTNLIKPAERVHGESEPSTTKLFGFVAARTPRSQQLIQEMASEGALLFPMPEGMVTADSSTGANAGLGIVSELNHDSECPHLQERPEAFDFVSGVHGEPGAASEACLELFPVRQEQIGWTPRVEVSGEVDLDLSLGKRSQAPSMPLL